MENFVAPKRRKLSRETEGKVDNRESSGSPGGTLGLLGESSRVAVNIKGFFSNRIGSALPDTGECHEEWIHSKIKLHIFHNIL